MSNMNKSGKLVLLLLANLVACFVLFFVGAELNFKITFIVYMVVFAAFMFAYVIYNRGFSRRNLTTDMLPDRWSYKEKLDFIEDGQARLERSKWMLTVIIPLIAIAGYLLLDLYVLPNFKGLFS